MNIALLFESVDLDRAFEWLDKAVQNRDPNLMDLAADLKLKDSPLKNDPRWLPFLESIGTSPAQLDAIEFKVTLPD